MHIFVKTVTGKIITLVNVEDTVDSVKEKIAQIEGIPVAQQLLLYSGREMEDGQSLSFYNIQENSTIDMELTHADGRGSWYRGGSLWKLASFHLIQKKICRKCYGQLPPNATRCRKAKCGRTSNIRDKKCNWDSRNRLPRRLTDWNRT